MFGKSPKFKILITDAIAADARSLLRDSGFKVVEKYGLSSKELHKILPRYDALICRTSTKLDKATFDSAPNLRCVGLSSTGYDQVDIEAATANNTIVLGLPSHNNDIDTTINGNFTSTAEHTMLLILAALGDFYNACTSMKAGRWEKSKFMGREARNSTLGIIGLGRIGKRVAELASAFDMNIITYDPYVSNDDANLYGARRVTLDELCRASSIITIHTPLTSETRGMLNNHTFSLMKQGVILVNASRTDIIEREPLMKALNNGKVYRYAVDVFRNESTPDLIEWDLVSHESVIPTPHIAGSTKEALRRISVGVAENVKKCLLFGEASHSINVEKPDTD